MKMKKIVSLSMASAMVLGASSAYAADMGIYIGGSVDRYYTVGAYVKNNDEALNDMNNPGASFDNIVYVDQHNNATSVRKLMNSESLTKALAPLQDGDLEDTYTDAVSGKIVKPNEEVAGLKVESVSAISATIVEVTFGTNEVAPTDESLAGKTVTLKAGEVALTATYKAGSLADNKATFQLSGEDKLVDATTYTASAEGMSFANAEFVAKVAATYIKTIEFTTTKVAADTAANNKNLVFFTAKDQYGEDLALTAPNTTGLEVTGTLNGVPFLASELEDQTDLSVGKIEINKNLVEGNKVVLTVKNTVNSEKITVGTVNYTIEAAEAAVETTVSNLVAKYNAAQNGHTNNAIATEVMPDDEITLTVDVKNQFGNKMTGANVRWVVEEGLSLIAADGDNLTSGAADLDETAEFKAIGAGKVKITAYLANGQNVSYEVTVGAKALASLSTTTESPATSYNNEDVIVRKIDPNAGAILKADMIKFAVTASTEGTTAADIALTASLRGGDTNPDDIIITAHTAKVGTYSVVAYVGDAVDAEGVIKAASFNVVTIANPTVASIEVESFTTNELTAGSEVMKAVTFKNKYGEVVAVNYDALSIAATANMTVKKYQEDKTAADSGTKKVAYLGFTGTAAGTDTVTLVSGAVTKQVSATVVTTSEVASIEFGAPSVSVIAGDTLDAETTAQDDMTLKVAGKTYTIVPITFKDQYGNVMAVKGTNTTGYDLKATATTEAGTNDPEVIFLDALADSTDAVDVGTATKDEDVQIKYIAIAAEQLTDVNKTFKVEIWKDADYAANKVLASANIDVNVKEARKAASFTAPTIAKTVTNGIAQTIEVSAIEVKDQYGRDFTVREVANNATDANKYRWTIEGQDANDAIAETYSTNDLKLTAKATGSGTETVTVKLIYNGATTDAADDVVVQASPYNMIVNSVANSIDRIEIQPTVTVAGAADADNGKYNAEEYKVKLTENDADQTIAFTVKAYNADGEEVAIDQSSIIYSVVATDMHLITTVKTSAFTANKLAVKADETSEDFAAGDNFTVKATTTNGKEDTMVVNVDATARVAQTGTYYLSDAATGEKVTSLDVNKTETVKAHIVAIDQYGTEVNVVEDNAKVLGVAVDDAGKATVTKTADGITIQGDAAGTTTLRVFLDGENSLTMTINVIEPLGAPLEETLGAAPAVEEEAPAVVEETPVVEEEAPAVVEEAPAVVEEAPAVVEETPAVEEVVPAEEVEQPAVEEAAPAEETPAQEEVLVVAEETTEA